MVFVKIREGESIEEALRRFKRDCQRSGILKEIRQREHYISPSLKKKLKKKEAQRKLRRRRTRSGGGSRGYGKFNGSAGRTGT